ncbi:MAG TPA: hypothetical protein VGW34_04185 [Allosphingosinicella sp.]|nr:hypothetical protein [Allosphingosinicella sp.]
MFTLLRQSSPQALALVQAPSFLAALAIAEMFYKFHSFLLETGAFLATWFAIDAIITSVLRVTGVKTR